MRACQRGARLGVGRAAVFGAASTLLPLLAHGAAPIVALTVTALVAAAFGCWTWMRGCVAPRDARVVVAAIGAVQLAVHMSAGALLGSSPHSHSGHHVAHGAAGSGGLDVSMWMLAMHVVAAIAAGMVLVSLDRRAARLVARGVTSLVAVVAAIWRAKVPPVTRIVRPTAATWGSTATAIQRIRLMVRSCPRRGPPSLVVLLPA